MHMMESYIKFYEQVLKLKHHNDEDFKNTETILDMLKNHQDILNDHIGFYYVLKHGEIYDYCYESVDDIPIELGCKNGYSLFRVPISGESCIYNKNITRPNDFKLLFPVTSTLKFDVSDDNVPLTKREISVKALVDTGASDTSCPYYYEFKEDSAVTDSCFCRSYKNMKKIWSCKFFGAAQRLLIIARQM